MTKKQLVQLAHEELGSWLEAYDCYDDDDEVDTGKKYGNKEVNDAMIINREFAAFLECRGCELFDMVEAPDEDCIEAQREIVKISKGLLDSARYGLYDGAIWEAIGNCGFATDEMFKVLDSHERSYRDLDRMWDRCVRERQKQAN